jgi:predicted DNA-binding antitoxin AbrB/MazE fold protein
MTKTVKVVFDGSVFRLSGPVNLEAGKKYTITVRPLPEEADAEQDPAFDISSLAVTTNIPDLSSEHDHYLHGLPKRGANKR